MKKTRFIPYGYTMKNGKLIIDDDEAEVIKRIFDEYRSGMSMYEMAMELVRETIPYCEKKVSWNKNVIARIIANEKYAGAEGYIPIIGITEFKVSLRVFKYIVTALLAVNFLYTYIPAMGNPSFEHVGFPALKFTFAPKTNNVSGARALADKLENYTSENGGYAYILASSETINDELIKNAYLPDKTSAVTNLFGTARLP